MGNDHVMTAPGDGWGCSRTPTANTVYQNLHIKFEMQIDSACTDGSGHYQAQVICDDKTTTFPSDTLFWYDPDGHQTDFGVRGAWSCGRSFRFQMWNSNDQFDADKTCHQTWQHWGLSWDETSS